MLGSKDRPRVSSYVTSGRLADVMTLIQILAFDPSARRTSDALTKQLSSSPLSADSWADIAKLHPEFFRVLLDDEGESGSVSLISRFVLKKTSTSSGDDSETPVLDADVANNLLSLAVQLHDREIQRRDRWKTVLVPTIVSFVTILGFFFTVFQFYRQEKQQEEAAAIQGRKDSEAAAVQQQKDNVNRERELTRELWVKRMQIYGDATSIASQLATAKQPAQRTKMLGLYEEIYYGKLPLVWDTKTCSAAKKFRDTYFKFQNDPKREMDLLSESNAFTRATRESLVETWQTPSKNFEPVICVAEESK